MRRLADAGATGPRPARPPPRQPPTTMQQRSLPAHAGALRPQPRRRNRGPARADPSSRRRGRLRRPSRPGDRSRARNRPRAKARLRSRGGDGIQFFGERLGPCSAPAGPRHATARGPPACPQHDPYPCGPRVRAAQTCAGAAHERPSVALLHAPRARSLRAEVAREADAVVAEAERDDLADGLLHQRGDHRAGRDAREQPLRTAEGRVDRPVRVDRC